MSEFTAELLGKAAAGINFFNVTDNSVCTVA